MQYFEPFLVVIYIIQNLFIDHINACENSPCLNGGTCATSFGLQTKCLCAAGYKGQHCEGLLKHKMYSVPKTFEGKRSSRQTDSLSR